MLVMRAAQIEVLEENSLRQFEHELVVHFREHLPDHYEALGEEGTRAAIRRGISKGQSYNIVSREGLTIFIRIMFLLGEEFDSELPWATGILKSPSPAVESDKIERLANACQAYLINLSKAS